MTPIKLYFPTHPGLAGSVCPAQFSFPSDSAYRGQDSCGFLSAFHVGRLFEKNAFPIVGGGAAYASGQWTTTTTGTSAAIAEATTPGGGILATCGSSSTFNTNLQSKATVTPSSAMLGKNFVALGRIQTSDITTVGFEFSFGTSAVDPDTTNYTDCVKLKMAVGAGTMVGSVRGASLTQSSSGTLNTAVAATDFFVGFVFNLGVLKPSSTATTVTTGTSSATQTFGATKDMQVGDLMYFATSALYRSVSSITNSTVAVMSKTISTTTSEVVTIYTPGGGFFAGSDITSATFTKFSQNQLIQLSSILGQATPPAMYLNLSAKGSAGTPTVTFTSVLAELDR